MVRVDPRGRRPAIQTSTRFSSVAVSPVLVRTQAVVVTEPCSPLSTKQCGFGDDLAHGSGWMARLGRQGRLGRRESRAGKWATGGACRRSREGGGRHSPTHNPSTRPPLPCISPNKTEIAACWKRAQPPCDSCEVDLYTCKALTEFRPTRGESARAIVPRDPAT